MQCRCADCGFLSTKPESDLVEVGEKARQKWGLSRRASGEPFHYFTLSPICFMGAALLADEAQAESGPNRFIHDEAVIGVISKSRECGSFVPWKKSYSPLEHRDMIHNELVRRSLEEQRENDRRWQQEQREKDRLWQEEQRRSDRDWQQTAKRQDRFFQIGMAIFVAVVGFAFLALSYFLGMK